MFLFIKRLFDIFFIYFFNILSSNNIYIFFFILVFERNPFFIQERSGINGKTIKIVKLQTMKNINEKKNITKLGNIRVSKIDELHN